MQTSLQPCLQKPQIRKMKTNNKHTELPSGWETLEFGECAELRKSKYVPNDSESLKCLELEHFNQETGDINGWIDSNLQKSTKNVFKNGDVLFGKLRPYLKKYWKAEFDGVSSSEVWVLKSNLKICDTNFLFRLVQTHRFIQVANVSSGSKMPRADWDYVSSYPFILPPLPEQRAIANILSTWDTAIQTTQALISQKEQEKKWLMQNLLTGKKRLKGYSGEWKDVKIGDVTTKFSRKNKDLIDCRVYSVTNYNGFVLQSDHFSREVAGDNLTGYKIIKKGEFAYNPARINVGSIAYFNDEIGIISSLYVCFSTNEEILDYFLEQIFKLDLVKHRIEAFGEGGVRVYLWYELFEKIKISIPNIEEQTAIAQVLQTADKEIALLKTKLEQQKLQKKGLMQVLLTGKVRVKN